MTYKAELRRKAEAARDALPADERIERSKRVMHHAGLFAARLSGTVGLYMPFRSEVNPLGLASLHHLSFAMPVIHEDGSMSFHAWDAGTATEKNRFGIDEPLANPAVIPDAIFTPLLAFDRSGARLGYGKGYYDRYFATTGKETLRIGLAFSMQLMRNLPTETHDIRLHATITERGIMRHKYKDTE